GEIGADAEPADVRVAVNSPPPSDVGTGAYAEDGIAPALGGIDDDTRKDAGREFEFGAHVPEPPSRQHVQRDGALGNDPVEGKELHERLVGAQLHAAEEWPRGSGLVGELDQDQFGEQTPAALAQLDGQHEGAIEILDDVAEAEVDLGAPPPAPHLTLESGRPEIGGSGIPPTLHLDG